MAERKRSAGKSGADLPSRDDIWQAATLLIGVYGREAVHYADGRRSEQEEIGDSDAARTWNLIASEIEQLMETAPAAQLH